MAESERWHNKFTALQRINYALTFGFKRLTDMSRSLAKEHSAHAATTRRELTDMANNMRTNYSAGLVNKLRVGVLYQN